MKYAEKFITDRLSTGNSSLDLIYENDCISYKMK